eukprot:scaffold323_cov414-Prasinococcus_capsulatus_cf.AAC.21
MGSPTWLRKNSTSSNNLSLSSLLLEIRAKARFGSSNVLRPLRLAFDASNAPIAVLPGCKAAPDCSTWCRNTKLSKSTGQARIFQFQAAVCSLSGEGAAL